VTSFLVVVSLAVSSLIAILIVARYRHQDVLRDWAGILSPEWTRTLEAVEEHAAMDRHMADDAWQQALTAHGSREFNEAVRLLELAYWVIEEATSGRLERLRAMLRVCRQVSAILPLPPVQPAAFGLRKVRAAAAVGAMLHGVLVAPAERLALRARTLAACFRLAVWTMRRARGAAIRRPAVGRAWQAFETALADWDALDLAHLETFRAAMMALAWELRREVAIPHRAPGLTDRSL
jgi:hypothetical protein